jgi:multicomponent K+:H+ antiporter subunit A
VAAGAGLGAAWLAYAVLTRGYDPISGYHLAQAKPGGGGTNVVNVILVDFRGYDTFGEIIVLGIAGIAIFALLDPVRVRAAGAAAAGSATAAANTDAHPMILAVAARVLLPLALTAGLYIFLRGHNLPGGGFIAGLVVAIAFIMQYMASGQAWAQERARINPQALIGIGVILAGITGLGAWLFGFPFLTSTYGHVDLPVVGQVELTSVIAFDAGVFLTVVGTTLLALASIAAVEPAPEPAEETPEPRRRRRAAAPQQVRQEEPA